MRKIGEMLMFASSNDNEAEAKLAGTIIDATKNIQKIHHKNDVMSSLLARIAVLVRDENISPATTVERIDDLLEWYDMHQAGVLNADIAGTKLSEETPGYDEFFERRGSK